jgi:hypothetical protein
MRRILLCAGLALFVAIGYGADFWEKKKFAEWTTKDADKMLKDSPWAQRVEVPIGGGGGPAMGGGGGGGRRGGGGGMPGGGGGGMPGGGGGDIEGGGGGGGRGGGGFGGGGDGPRPTMSLMVRWQTALPVRQAVAKIRFGDEAATAPQARQMLERQENAYIIGLIGLPPMMLRGGRTEGKGGEAKQGGREGGGAGIGERMKQAVQLKRKDREPLRPVNVQGEMDQTTQRANVYLVFPKDGANEITLEDKEIEFEMKLGMMELKRKFKLKDMVYEGKLEL